MSTVFWFFFLPFTSQNRVKRIVIRKTGDIKCFLVFLEFEKARVRGVIVAFEGSVSETDCQVQSSKTSSAGQNGQPRFSYATLNLGKNMEILRHYNYNFHFFSSSSQKVMAVGKILLTRQRRRTFLEKTISAFPSTINQAVTEEVSCWYFDVL